MQKELLIQFVNQNLSANTIAKRLNLSLSTVRYWLKKHNLKTNFVTFRNRIKRIEAQTGNKTCPSCKLNKDVSLFYLRKNKTDLSSYCKQCFITRTLTKQKTFKNLCVEYKGGSCINCGYNKYVGALDFHHLDPSKKDFEISRLKSLKFDERIKQELDKCVLLCSNCHREAHSYLKNSTRLSYSPI